MFRLFKIRVISLRTSSAMTTVHYSLKMCLFCNHWHQHKPRYIHEIQMRCQSSNKNKALLNAVTEKKFKRRKKKHEELLEAPNSPGHLSGSSNVFVNNLAKNEKNIIENEFILKEEEKDENELIVEELEASGIIDETVLIKSSTLASSMKDSTHDYNIQDGIIKLNKSSEMDHLEESEEKVIDKERKARESLVQEEKVKQFNKIILGYIDVCVNSNELSLAKNLFYTYRKNKRYCSGYVYINDISVFNVQIKKLASNSDLQSILQMLEKLREDNISLNAQTYLHTLECIGRMTSDHKIDILKQIYVEMQNDNISLNDIMTKTIFVRDQRIFVDKMVKLIKSEFQPTFNTIDTNYNCRLLNNINDCSNILSSSIGDLLTIEDIQKRLKTQIEMEIYGEVSVQNIAKKNSSTRNVNHWRRKLLNLEKTWEKTALNSFIKNLSMLKSQETFNKNRRIMLYPYLSVLKPEDYVCIIMRQVRNLGMGSEMYSLPFNSLCRIMGDQVYKMYEAKTKQTNGVNDKIFKVHMQYCHWLINRKDHFNNRMKWALLEQEGNKYGVSLGADVPSWQTNIHMSIGRFLFNIIVNELKLDANSMKMKKNHFGREHYIPAFFKIYRHSGVMLKEEVKPHPLVSKLYRDSQPENLNFDTTLVPSICPPRPWISLYSGGYIITKTDIVRVSQMGNQQWSRLVSTPTKQLYPALDSLNQLASVPWAINTAVLDVAIEVFQNDGSVELNMPQPPSVLAPIVVDRNTIDHQERKKIDKARIELNRKKNEMYSLWCDALYRLSLANHFRNEIFWLPHNMDFRGRVYPVPPHLNHLGSDLARSMLMFAMKKPLGPEGLNWLKLHTINLTGFKKRESVSDRLNYANEIIEDILDSAKNPLTGKMWWAKSEEPWQTLAACIEIAKALQSPDPVYYATGFPIHQDGSCNGLQHYAALGRDQIGAESVNLFPSYCPQDVYSSVASMVDERRREEAKNGNQIAQVLEGFIKRKVIKQTIMTTVYGVTWFGAKLQIARQLKDINDFPQEHLWTASTYLVQKTFDTLRTMFKSAREIQDWFTECARLICITREQNMEWETPLGLPVVQPYSKISRNSVNKNHISPYFTTDIYRKPNIMKQKNAFAPNFVHSLDSSHMMLTSIYSERANITFVSVHDCYWTHPCSAEIMNKICREQFVALHSEPILEDLSKFFITKFGFADSDMTMGKDNNVNKNLMKKKLNSVLSNVPQKGNFDLKEVLHSTYFFS